MQSEKTSPKVIIGLLNWNEIDYTESCIKSLNNLDYRNFEIILLDNGSVDNSVNILEKIEKKGKITLLTEKNNLGFTGGNNKIINYALKNKKFDYLLLLNNDTLVEKDFLSKQVYFMESHKDAGVVGPLIFSKKGKLSFDDSPGKFNLFLGGSSFINLKKTNLNREQISVDYISGCSMLMRKSLLKKMGGLNEKYFIYNEEVEFCYRAKNKNYNIYLLPKSKIYHIGHATTSKISGFKIRLQTRNTIYFEKENATKMEYFIFLIYLFFYKTPKALLKNFYRKDRKKVLSSYFKGMYEGLKE